MQNVLCFVYKKNVPWFGLTFSVYKYKSNGLISISASLNCTFYCGTYFSVGEMGSEGGSKPGFVTKLILFIEINFDPFIFKKMDSIVYLETNSKPHWQKWKEE